MRTRRLSEQIVSEVRIHWNIPSIKNLAAALAEVIASFKQVRISGYHTGDDFSVNVILQEMVLGEISGVGFSVNPLEQENENPMVSIIPGLGFKLVSGEENGMDVDLTAMGPGVMSLAAFLQITKAFG